MTQRAPCHRCGQDSPLVTDGTVRAHRQPGRTEQCAGSRQLPGPGPLRLHRRSPDWQMPEGAVDVDRPSKWANPFQVGASIGRNDPLFRYLADAVPGGAGGFSSITALLEESVQGAYAWWLVEQPALMLSLRELAGRDLVTSTPPGRASHADFLLELANSPDPE
jgi:hypothetical protein